MFKRPIIDDLCRRLATERWPLHGNCLASLTRVLDTSGVSARPAVTASSQICRAVFERHRTVPQTDCAAVSFEISDRASVSRQQAIHWPRRLPIENCQKLDFHFNSTLSALNLAKLQAWQNRDPNQPFIFSMAGLKRRALNAFLLDIFISKLALSPDVIKSHPNCETLRSYGVIAA